MEGDYLDLLQGLYSTEKNQQFEAPAARIGGYSENQLMNTVIQNQADEPQVLQEPMPASFSMMQPIDSSMQPCLTPFQNVHQIGQWNALPSVQQNWAMKEECCSLITESCQQPSQVLSTSPYSQTFIDENKHSIQSPMTSTTTSSPIISQELRNQIQNARLQRSHTTNSSAFASFPIGQNINLSDWKILIIQHQRVKSAYLPLLIKVLKRAQEQCFQLFNVFQGQNMKQLQAAERFRTMCEQMIKFLHLSGDELMMHFHNEIVYQHLHKIVRFCKNLLNDRPITPSQRTTLVENSTTSSYLQPNYRNSPICSDAHAKNQMDKEIMLLQDNYAFCGNGLNEKSTMSGGSQMPQPSNGGQIHLKKVTVTPSEHTMLIKESKNSSCLQPDSLNSPSCMSGGSQMPQPSNGGQIHLKNVTVTPSEHTILIKESKNSSCLQPDSLNSPSCMSGGSQMPQPSNGGQIHLKNVTVTPSEHTILIKESKNSSCLQPDSLNSPSCSYAHRMQHGPKDTTDNAHLNMKKNRRLRQSSNENQPLKVRQSRKQKKPPEKKAPAKTVQKKNKAFDVDHKAMSQHKPMKTTVDFNGLISPSSHTTLINESPISSCLSSLSSPICSDATVDKETLLQQGPKDTADNAVQSVSKEALTSSKNDIASAMMAMDKLPEYANHVDSTSAKHSQKICCDTGVEYMPQRILKRRIESVGVLDNSGSCTKRARNELDRYLMDEISKINQRLIETVVEVDFDSDSDSRLEFSNSIIIKCTYKPVAFIEDLARHVASITSMTPLSVKFLIPSDYPSSPPKILEQLPAVFCEESIDWMKKVHSRFDHRVRGLVSLREMAQAWNDSARSVFSDFVLSIGGGSFSSKYGSWERVHTA